jgi:hypothetical protein
VRPELHQTARHHTAFGSCTHKIEYRIA